MILKRILAWFLTMVVGLGLLAGWAFTEPDPVLASSAGTLADLFIPGVAVGSLFVGTVAFLAISLLQGLGYATGSRSGLVRRPRVWGMILSLPFALLLLHYGVFGWMVTLIFVTLETRLPVGQGKAA